MKLIDQIIEILSDESPNLENALIKTKVLLHKLGQKNLITWVNNELNGYYEDNEIPRYRKLVTRIVVTATDGFTTRWKKIYAPINHLDDELRESLGNQNYNQSISSIEYLIQTESDTVILPLPTELCPLIAQGLGDGIYVETAAKEIAKSQLIQIRTHIRSKLMDFLLELSEKIPNGLTDEKAKEVSNQVGVENLFNNTVFGSNTTIVIGNDNIQEIHNKKIKNDLSYLFDTLKKNNVSDEDIEHLNSAIKLDENSIEHTKKQYGKNVKSWVKTMMNKAVDTSWQIELGVASSTLASALNAYYGWF